MSEMKVLMEGSGKHCHLCEATFKTLFGADAEMDQKKMLSQPGQYATSYKVTVVGPKGETKMSVLGPYRPEDQIELSLTDARPLGIDAPIRMSGDLAGTPGCTLIGTVGSVEIKQGCMVALRHIHLSVESGEKWGIKDGDPVLVKCGGNGPRPLIFDNVVARVSPAYADAMHIDYDEVNAACLLEKEPYGEIIKK